MNSAKLRFWTFSLPAICLLVAIVTVTFQYYRLHRLKTEFAEDTAIMKKLQQAASPEVEGARPQHQD